MCSPLTADEVKAYQKTLAGQKTPWSQRFVASIVSVWGSQDIEASCIDNAELLQVFFTVRRD